MNIEEFYILTVLLYLNTYKSKTIIKNIEDMVKKNLKSIMINILKLKRKVKLFLQVYIFNVNERI